MSIQDVKEENTFWLKGGKGIKNIMELNRELKQMNEDTFSHHVNNEKNDFANWIEHSVKDAQLAALVRTTKNNERMAAIIERKIQQLTIPTIEKKTEIKQQKKPEIKQQKKQEIQKKTPTIIRTENVTPLTIAHKKEVIHAGKTTKLCLNEGKEIYIHEPKQHYEGIQLFSYISIGFILGAAIVVISIALL